MFRDQTEADLHVVQVPVRQGMCEATGGNPDASKPIGGNRAAEFGAYFADRRANSRIAAMRRETIEEPPMTMDEAVEIVLAGMGLRGGWEGDTSAHADGRGGSAGSDGE